MLQSFSWAFVIQFNPRRIEEPIGGMNGLTREDYSVRTQKEQTWEQPSFDLQDLLPYEWDYQDAFENINSKRHVSMGVLLSISNGSRANIRSSTRITILSLSSNTEDVNPPHGNRLTPTC